MERLADAGISEGRYRGLLVDGLGFDTNLKSPLGYADAPDIVLPQRQSDNLADSTSSQTNYVSPNFQGILLQEPAETRRQHLASKERPALFNAFGIGSRHVFQNYWTSRGGLPEVIAILPS